jgi:hypothetical protein
VRPRDHFGVSIHFLLPIAEFTEGPAHCREADRQPKCKTIGLSSRRGILSRNGPALGTAASRVVIVLRLEGRRFCVSQRTLSPREEPRRTTTAGNTRPGVLCVLKILPAERLAPASPNPTEHPIGRCCAESDSISSFGIEPKETAFRSPWQNGVAERWVGTVKRDLLDHVIVLDEDHLHRLLREYVEYHNTERVHTVLRDSPEGRAIEIRPASSARVTSQPRLGGLHHRYKWQAAA